MIINVDTKMGFPFPKLDYQTFTKLVYVLILQVGILLWEIRNSQHIYQVGNLKYFPVINSVKQS